MLDRFIFNRVTKHIAHQANKEQKTIEEIAPTIAKNPAGFRIAT